MKHEMVHKLSPEMLAAIEEMKALVLSKYPAARFQVIQAPDEPGAIHLNTIIDVDDLEEVVDLIMDRMMQFMIEDELPFWVVPVHSTEYALAQLAASRVDLSAPVPAALP
jgi:hypothetical protein